METVELKPLPTIVYVETVGGDKIAMRGLADEQVKRILDQLVTDTMASIKQSKMNHALQGGSGIGSQYYEGLVPSLGNLFRS